MSYILDALKKSEAERARGAVPNLHTQSDSAMLQDGDQSKWIWIALAALAAMAAAFVWFMMSQTAATQRASAPLREQAPSRVITEAPQAKPAAPTAPAVSAFNIPAPMASVPASVLQKAVPTESVKPKIEPNRIEAKVAASQQPKPAPVPEPLPVKKAEPAEVTAALSENRIGTLRELPGNIQKDIPPVAFSGYIYSSNAADRSVLIGNRLLREGDQVAAGLTLEKMLPKEAILNYMGYRFRVSY